MNFFSKLTGDGQLNVYMYIIYQMDNNHELSPEGIKRDIIDQAVREIAQGSDMAVSEVSPNTSGARELLNEVFEQKTGDKFKELLMKLVITCFKNKPKESNEATTKALGLPTKIRYFLTQFESRFTFENVRNAAEVISNHNTITTDKLVNEYRDWIYKDEDEDDLV